MEAFKALAWLAIGIALMAFIGAWIMGFFSRGPP